MAEKVAEEMRDEMSVYDVSFHIVGNVPEDEVPTHATRIKSYVESAGGVMLAERAPEMMQLAYRLTRKIKERREDYDTSYFGWIAFELPSDAIASVDAALKSDLAVLRYLIIKSDRPSVEAAQKLAEKGVKEPKEVISEAQLDKTIADLTT